jgi:exonuclease 3'-5' domain-containing protein 1
MSGSFTLCTNIEEVKTSLDILKNAAFLIVDCEGRELGCRDGALSLISIGTQHSSEVFVYDAVQLGHLGLAPLLELLASPEIMKIVWDGRMDFSEIYHTYGTKLENTLDLQIVEVVSRARRGEHEEHRLTRLKSYFSPYAVDRFTSEYEDLQI